MNNVCSQPVNQFYDDFVSLFKIAYSYAIDNTNPASYEVVQQSIYYCMSYL